MLQIIHSRLFIVPNLDTRVSRTCMLFAWISHNIQLLLTALLRIPVAINGNGARYSNCCCACAGVNTFVLRMRIFMAINVDDVNQN